MNSLLRPDRRRNFFFSASDCGCTGTPQTGNSTPLFPNAGYATICDDRYLQLPTTATGRVLIVMPGSNCQVFLKSPVDGSGNPLPGFLWINPDNTVQGIRTPALTLPFINPAVSGSHPATATFTALMATASGADPHAWQFYKAPTSGQFILQSDNGVFRFVDSGAAPGLTAACAAGTTTVVHLTGCSKIGENGSGDPIYAMRKIAVTDKRVLVGVIPTNGDPPGVKTLPDNTPLVHPFGEFTDTLRMLKFVHLDSSGNPITDGLATSVAFGANSIADLSVPMFSPTTKKFVFRPTPVAESLIVAVSASVSPTASYALIPSGHCQMSPKAIHYPKVRVTAVINLGTDENVDFALFRDGVMIQEFNFSTPELVVCDFIDQNVPAGNRTYDIRQKRGAGSSTGTWSYTVRYSSLTVQTLVH